MPLEYLDISIVIEQYNDYPSIILKSGWKQFDEFVNEELSSYYIQGERNSCNGTRVHNNGILSIIWYSIINNAFYETNVNLQEYNDAVFSSIIIGLFPYGIIPIWGKNSNSRVLLKYILSKNDVLQHTVCPKTYLQINNNQYRRELKCPPISYFLEKLKSFVYRYKVLIEKWVDSDSARRYKYISHEMTEKSICLEESLCNNTFDKLHDGGLMEYHRAGKPKKLRVEWHVGKTEYSAYFWFEDEKIREVFDRFYRDYPETKSDFIIRIDGEQKKYELSLFKEGLEEPQIIPEDVYQLLVFKNKFEDYRSENYNQERGAWIW